MQNIQDYSHEANLHLCHMQHGSCSLWFEEVSLAFYSFYRDTFWVIDGLLVCDMKDTARGMIENFIYLIDK